MSQRHVSNWPVFGEEEMNCFMKAVVDVPEVSLVAAVPLFAVDKMMLF